MKICLDCKNRSVVEVLWGLGDWNACARTKKTTTDPVTGRKTDSFISCADQRASKTKTACGAAGKYFVKADHVPLEQTPAEPTHTV